MKKALRLISAFVIASTFSGALLAQDLLRFSPEWVGLSPERLERLENMLDQYVEDERHAGYVIRILRDGREVYHHADGMRNIEEQLPMEKDTIFRIASMTKAVVSTGVMILQEQGKLDINDPLSEYFPEWGNATVAVAKEEGGYDVEPVATPITLRHLLTHTAGIGYGNGPATEAWKAAGINGWYFASNEEPIGETVARMAALPIDAQPGTKYVYGYSTDILGAVIEKASGQDLSTFLQLEIFEPLSMRDTYFYLPEDKHERLAVVYRPKEGGGIEPVPGRDGMRSQGRYTDGPQVSFSGGAGLLSTARDYSRFLQMTLNGGKLNDARILSRKSIELMTVNHIDGIEFRPGRGFGLGYWVVTDLGERALIGSDGEYGWGGAYHTTYWADKDEKLVVVYMTQLLPSGGIDDYKKLRNGVYQAIDD